MMVLFVDLKVAFDSVNRGVLVDLMKKKGIREGLIIYKRCEEVLTETINRVRIEREEGKDFWTMRGVRQGCPLSPCLFTIMLADMDEELEKKKWDGVRLGRRRVRTLAYADDIAVLAKDEGRMKSMIRWLKEYLDKIGLILNTGKK